MARHATRTSPAVRSVSAPLRGQPDEVIHVGVDVHKATYHVALLSDRRGLLATWVQPARPEPPAERLAPLREQIAQVVYEAGPTGFALARRLLADGFPAEVIAPSKVLAAPGPEPKTDRPDCRRLATFAQKGLLVRQEAWERRKRQRKPFDGTLRVTNPVRQSLASSRKRVLRGPGATRTAKRRQPVSGSCH